MVEHRVRYRLVAFSLLAAAACLLPVGLLTRGPDASADVVVIAQRLDMGLTAWPRYGEAVFGNGAVAQAVATELGSDVDPADVVPDRVSLVAEPDTIALRVVGHAEDQATAERIADTAAGAFVAVLNEPGAGVGEFAVLGAAGPSDPPDTVSDGVLADLPVAITVVLAVGVLVVFTRLAGRLQATR